MSPDQQISGEPNDPQRQLEGVLWQEGEIQRLKSQLHHDYPEVSTSGIEEAIVKATQSVSRAEEVESHVRGILGGADP